MLKKFSKFLLLTLLIFVISTSSFVCLAHVEDELTNVVTLPETNEEETTTDDTETTEENLHTSDLYLFGNEIVMDKMVDGDVFIIGNKVKITGQVNGSLYVIANKISFDGALIRYSIFACADYMYYNNGGTYESNAYIIANTLDATYTSYVARDLKALVSDITLKSAVGRDADLICNTLDLGEGEDIPLIYGDLRYTANNELTIPDDAVEGSSTYSKQYLGNSVVGILMSFGTCIVTALSALIILSKLTPKFVEKLSSNKLSVLSLLKAFVIGLATIATVAIFMILLIGTGVGIILAVILGLLLIILYILANPVFAIRITNALKRTLRIENTTMFYLVLALISSILYGITFIPVFGFALGLIINVIAIGLIVNVFLPQKELTDEEKSAIKEKEKQTNELKEKRKKEKLEAKAIKKEEKIKVKNDTKQAKESKKKDKEN